MEQMVPSVMRIVILNDQISCLYIDTFVWLYIYTYSIRGNSNYHKCSILQVDIFTDQAIPFRHPSKRLSVSGRGWSVLYQSLCMGSRPYNWTITNMFKCLKCKNLHLWIASMDGYGLWIRESEFHPKTAEHKVQDSSRLGTWIFW